MTKGNHQWILMKTTKIMYCVVVCLKRLSVISTLLSGLHADFKLQLYKFSFIVNLCIVDSLLVLAFLLLQDHFLELRYCMQSCLVNEASPCFILPLFCHNFSVVTAANPLLHCLFLHFTRNISLFLNNQHSNLIQMHFS